MRLQGKAAQLCILSGALDSIGRSADYWDRIDIILDALSTAGFNDEAVVSLLTPTDHSGTKLQARRGPQTHLARHPEIIPVNGSLSGRVFETKKIVNLASVDPNSSGVVLWPQRELFIKSIAGLPAFCDGEVKGVLTITSSKKNAFGEREIAFLAPYAALFGSCLRQANASLGVSSLIATARKRQVLILGKDSGVELQRLLDIAAIIKGMGYEPMLVKHQPDIPEMSNEEKVRVFADHARFVILENSFPAGQIVEMKMCSTNRVITATLREKGKGSSFMVTDYFNDYHFMSEFEYVNETNSFRSAIQEAVRWAEAQIAERVEYYNSLYPWRQPQAN